ncbi:hypothetical protein A7K94_0200220 [Modestobacter sp. VKM Ac-2676]|nr:hypothetical protein A7K94_0200220 [Modestobacter sp. VKM Ac-2676]
MKITEITAVPLLMRSANQPMTFFVVRVATDDGRVGLGEACDCFGVSHPTVLARIVEDVFAPGAAGRRGRRRRPGRGRRRAGDAPDAGGRDVAAQARSAVAIALTDLAAQEAGRSVSDVLGRVRDSVRVYVGSSPFLETSSATEHLDRLARLTAGAFGLGRVAQARKDALAALVPASVRVVDFVWPDGLDRPSWTGFRRDPAATRPMEQVAPEEIGNAMVALCRASAGMTRDELFAQTLEVFGYRRRTSAQVAVLESALAAATSAGRLTATAFGLLTA